MRIKIFEVIAKIFVQKERGNALQNHRVRVFVYSVVGNEHSSLETSEKELEHRSLSLATQKWKQSRRARAREREREREVDIKSNRNERCENKGYRSTFSQSTRRAKWKEEKKRGRERSKPRITCTWHVIRARRSLSMIRRWILIRSFDNQSSSHFPFHQCRAFIRIQIQGEDEKSRGTTLAYGRCVPQFFAAQHELCPGFKRAAQLITAMLQLWHWPPANRKGERR